MNRLQMWHARFLCWESDNRWPRGAQYTDIVSMHVWFLCQIYLTQWDIYQCSSRDMPGFYAENQIIIDTVEHGKKKLCTNVQFLCQIYLTKMEHIPMHPLQLGHARFYAENQIIIDTVEHRKHKLCTNVQFLCQIFLTKTGHIPMHPLQPWHARFLHILRIRYFLAQWGAG